MENLRLKSKDGSAKVIGALICFGGALLISLYNGKELHRSSPIIKVSPTDSNGAAGGHHLRGTLLLLGDCISYAFWYPIQVHAVLIGCFLDHYGVYFPHKKHILISVVYVVFFSMCFSKLII
jgi:hypothetical protein